MRQTVSEANKFLRQTVKSVEAGGVATLAQAMEHPGTLQEVHVTTLDAADAEIPAAAGLSEGIKLPTRIETKKLVIIGKFPIATQAEYDALTDAMKDKAVLLTVDECPIGSEVKAIECNTLGIPVDAHYWIMGLDGWKGGSASTLLPDGSTSFAGPVQAPGIKAPGVRFPRTRVVSHRLTGSSGVATGTFTGHLCRRAPAHYDAMQIVIRGSAASAANAFAVSIAPTAKYNNGWAAIDAADAPITRTAVTWGSTNKADFWNPGGGATTSVANEASGTIAANTLRENAAVSDWMFVRSLDRADDPTKPPLYHVRLYGVKPPMINMVQLSGANANPVAAVDPELYCGVWSANDYTATEAPNAPSSLEWMPAIEVRFLLRDKSIISVAVASDSLEQGWVAATASPQFGGLQNGWPRKLVAALNAEGVTASYFSAAWAGKKSLMFHNMAFRALQVPNPGITHLLIKPWSINESADGIASAESGISRTNQTIAMCDALGVVPVVIQPWAGQGLTTAMGIAVTAYCDHLRSEGRHVFDARAIVDPTGSGAIADAYLTKTSGGATVDSTHLNEAGQTAVAAYALTQCPSWGIQ